jgi:hypothetical protein
MERISGGALGVYLDVIPDWRIFCYTLAVSLTTGIAIGIWPAMRASRGDPVAALKPGSAGSIRGRHSRSKRNLALTAQVAACLTLLAGAGLLFRGAWSGSGVSPAFETRHLMVVSFDPTTEARDMLLRQSVQRLEEMPEVAAVAWAAGPPFLGHGSGEFRNQRGSSFTSPFNLVSAGYFDTLGLRLVAGRGFTAEEAETAAPVAVIDESLARRAWPGRNAVGRKIRLGERTEFMHASATVIGVVRNLRRGFCWYARAQCRSGRFIRFWPRSQRWMPICHRRRISPPWRADPWRHSASWRRRWPPRRPSWAAWRCCWRGWASSV